MFHLTFFERDGTRLTCKILLYPQSFIFPYLNYYNFNQKTVSNKSKPKVLTSFTSKHEFTARTREVSNVLEAQKARSGTGKQKENRNNFQVTKFL